MSSIYNKNFGPYEIEGELNTGEMGTVLLARDPRQQQVVLKLIKVRPSTADIVEAARRGAELQKELAKSEQRVAKIIETGELGGYFYIVMEYVDGDDLGSQESVDDAVADVIEVCKMLEAAHRWNGRVEGKEQRGIVHGDIKPSNVRKNSRGEIKVLDFQISKSITASRQRTRNSFASTAYSSPERLETGYIDVNADLWSVGVLLYELVTGKLPYGGYVNTSQLEKKIKSHDRPPWPGDLPKALGEIIDKILAPDVNLRYRSASELRAALEAFRRDWKKKSDPTATRRTTHTPGGPSAGASGKTVRTQPSPAAAPSGPNGGATAPNATVRSAAHAANSPVGVNPPAASTPATAAAVPPAAGATTPFGATLRAFMPSVARIVALLAVLAVVGVVGYAGYGEFSCWRRAKQLQQAIKIEDPKTLDSAWGGYEELSGQVWWGGTLRGLKDGLGRGLSAATDKVIKEYYEDGDRDSPEVGPEDWKHAQTCLERANKLGAAGDPAQAKLEYFRGHIRRLNDSAPDQQLRRGAIDDALRHFNEAVRLKPDWPDPHLGMARIYAFSLNDTARAVEALRRAEELGYAPRKRERATLAQHHKLVGNQAAQEARRLYGQPAEVEALGRAEENYRQALELLQAITPYGQSETEIRYVSVRLDAVRRRLADLRPADSEEESPPPG